MLLISHIIVALSGLGLAAFCYFKPTLVMIKIISATTAYTLTSGTILVVKMHASLTSACLSGLIYLAAVLGATLLGYKKLQTAKQID